MSDKEYAYDTGQTDTSVVTYTDVFSNSKTSDCAITSCTLKQTGCSNALVAPFDSLLSIDGSSPWALKISQT